MFLPPISRENSGSAIKKQDNSPATVEKQISSRDGFRVKNPIPA